MCRAGGNAAGFWDKEDGKGGRVEGWKIGRVEGWKGGRREGWKIGRMEGWKGGRLEGRKTEWKEDGKGGRREGWIERVAIGTIGGLPVFDVASMCCPLQRFQIDRHKCLAPPEGRRQSCDSTMPAKFARRLDRERLKFA